MGATSAVGPPRQQPVSGRSAAPVRTWGINGALNGLHNRVFHIGQAGYIYFVAQCLALICVLAAAGYVQAAPPHTDILMSLDASGMKLAWSRKAPGAEQKTCMLQIKAQKAQLSYDGSAVILSDVEFVPTSSLGTCGSKALTALKIASNVGSLVDVNVSKKLYLTLDIISTSPLAFLATVGKFGSTRNLVTLPGAYVQGRSLPKLQEQGFAYNPDIHMDRPRISPNGQYVSPGGAPDCSRNAYPGVWDIARNKHVVCKGTRLEHQAACDALFQ